MAITIAEFIEAMNAALPRIPRHPSRGLCQSSRYDGHSCHCTVDLAPEEIDREDAPATLHAQTPEEG